jgi:hypothetical protein
MNYKEYTAQKAIDKANEEKYCTVEGKDILGSISRATRYSGNIDTLSDV